MSEVRRRGVNIYFRICSDPVTLFWYQISLVTAQIESNSGILLVVLKFRLYKGFPLMYYTEGGSCRLYLKIRL